MQNYNSFPRTVCLHLLPGEGNDRQRVAGGSPRPRGQRCEGRPPTFFEEKAEGRLTVQPVEDCDAVCVGSEALDYWVPDMVSSWADYRVTRTIRCIEVPWVTLVVLHHSSIIV